VSALALVELRQYTLKPGARETLVDLFDRHFIEGQECHGMSVIGQFRDIRSPDRFVWLRGFPDMESRRRALEGFYTGPVWREHGPAANATMIDFHDVLLLRPLSPDAGFDLDRRLRPAPDAPAAEDGRRILVSIHHLPADAASVARVRRKVEASLAGTPEATLLAQLVTEPARNTFPRLAVREGVHVYVWVAACAREEAVPALAPDLPAERLLLQSTRRSLLR
jgi:hypothetical protein